MTHAALKDRLALVRDALKPMPWAKGEAGNPSMADTVQEAIAALSAMEGEAVLVGKGLRPVLERALKANTEEGAIPSVLTEYSKQRIDRERSAILAALDQVRRPECAEGCPPQTVCDTCQGDTAPPPQQAVGDDLREVKLRLHFLGMPGEPMWNAGSDDAPRWVPDWRFEIDLIEHALHGSPRTFASRPTDTRRRIETEAHPTPSPGPQGGGEYWLNLYVGDNAENYAYRSKDAAINAGCPEEDGDRIAVHVREVATPTAHQPGEVVTDAMVERAAKAMCADDHDVDGSTERWWADEIARNEYIRYARINLAAALDTARQSEGMVLVPREPTEAMIVAGFESEPDPVFSSLDEWEKYDAMSGCRQAAHRTRLCWAAMLAAADAGEGKV